MFGGLISRGISLRHVNLLHKENYKGYVGDFLKNSKDSSGNLLFKGNEVEALRKEVGLESIHAELGKKRSELTKISLQKADKKQKLIQIQNQIKAFESGRIDHLRTQLKHLGDKLTDPSNQEIITYQETIAIRTLVYFLTDLEKEGKLETPLTPTEKGYLTKVEQLEAIRNAKLPTYNT
ncbi:4689_t:CDS:2 [Paraglomus brasilianum]|uniref:4689_t:CDS:1 n=1 Tax=Paraglomus brasilianum TaxID=144538 RepID=A0A9N9GIB8_9GLOM|nr:4689_t:CDS:2 [Paraglomus brasilianum]